MCTFVTPIDGDFATARFVRCVA